MGQAERAHVEELAPRGVIWRGRVWVAHDLRINRKVQRSASESAGTHVWLHSSCRCSSSRAILPQNYDVESRRQVVVSAHALVLCDCSRFHVALTRVYMPFPSISIFGSSCACKPIIHGRRDAAKLPAGLDAALSYSAHQILRSESAADPQTEVVQHHGALSIEMKLMRGPM